MSQHNNNIHFSAGFSMRKLRGPEAQRPAFSCATQSQTAFENSVNQALDSRVISVEKRDGLIGLGQGEILPDEQKQDHHQEKNRRDF
jgi:hypothetical protein